MPLVTLACRLHQCDFGAELRSWIHREFKRKKGQSAFVKPEEEGARDYYEEEDRKGVAIRLRFSGPHTDEEPRVGIGQRPDRVLLLLSVENCVKTKRERPELYQHHRIIIIFLLLFLYPPPSPPPPVD